MNYLGDYSTNFLSKRFFENCRKYYCTAMWDVIYVTNNRLNNKLFTSK